MHAPFFKVDLGSEINVNVNVNVSIRIGSPR
jgi:hypothetical protein